MLASSDKASWSETVLAGSGGKAAHTIKRRMAAEKACSVSM
jgi:hypothetical protein